MQINGDEKIDPDALRVITDNLDEYYDQNAIWK